MNWGNLLLDGIGDMVQNVIAEVGNWFSDLFPTLFYWIWELLAHVVGFIESIFRNLAGLGDGENNDMVSRIINDDNVGKIFGNLVGFATALIVFFTIVKILQDHYKDKEGGNPYKIVLRTFKGLLMFFFVNAAVTVGLMATRTLFKGLDAATGSGGTASIAGQVFKAMVAGDGSNPGANRKRIGAVTSDDGFGADARNKYFYRMDANSAASHGRYVMVDMTDSDTPDNPKELQAKYQELFPDTQYGIVSADGKTVTPLSQWSTLADEDSNPYKDAMNDWKNEYLKGDELNNWTPSAENNSVSGTVGYRNDILRHISTTVQPSIDLTWSPIDIYNYGFSLYETEVMKHDIDTSVMGTGTVIPMSTTFVRYGDPIITMKSMEDSAKMFGISINGKVALQGGEASASFNIDVFDNQFGDILYTIVSNVLYTNLTQMLVQAIPAFPASTSIYTFKINYLQLLAPLIMKVFEATNQSIMECVGFIPKDKNGNPLAETFVINPSSHNSNIWVSVNDKSKYVPITIEKYQIDGNFTDLWSQLVDNYDQFIEQAEAAETETWNQYESNMAAMDRLQGKLLNEQKEWMTYKGLVERYNNVVANNLPELAKQLSLYEELITNVPTFESDRENMMDVANEFLTQKGFSGSVETLETSIKGKFCNMVKHYIDASAIYANAKPSSSYADPIAVPSIYKPAIEFMMTKNYAEDLTVPEIRDTLFNLDNKGYVKVNMVFDNDAAYRMIDWDSYPALGGGSYRGAFGQYADFYVTPSKDTNQVPDVENQNVRLVKHTSLEELAFIRIPKDISGWKDQGVNYFRSNHVSGNNPFLVNHGKTFHDNAYWGERGISVDNIRYYQEYTGTVPTPSLGMDHGFADTSTTAQSLNTAAVNKVQTRTSSANINAAKIAAKKALSAELATMTDVDTTTPLANEFAKNIITFRRLDAASDKSEDRKALKSWIKQGVAAKPSGDFEAKQLTGATADQIDDLFASSGSPRRYLMLTKEGTTLDADGENLEKYLGVMSYADLSAVKHIYNINDINFIIGYIALVSALGVYMNFAFGLIQRAVNMTVLYVMSPITISFYPFDDGSKFSSQFVTPFYKEAISAFSVILSLNLFIVFLKPVKEAVGAVTGIAALEWLGLVAFVTMLPQIRSKIEGVLGAGGLAQKSLGQMWGEAKKAVGADAVKKAKQNALKGAAGALNAFNRMKAMKQDRDAKKLAKLEKREKDGKLSFLERKKLDKMRGYNAHKKRLDDALASGDDSALSKREKKQVERIRNAADKQALLKAGAKGANETQEQYAARVAEEKAKLLNDNKFRKSVNGVLKSHPRLAAAAGKMKNVASSAWNAAAQSKFGQGVGKAVDGVGKAIDGIGKGLGKVGEFGKAAGGKIKDAYDKVADSKFGQGVGKVVGGIGKGIGAAGAGVGRLARGIGHDVANAAEAAFGKGSFLGEMVRAKYGMNGTLAKDKNSVWGEIMRWKNPIANQEAQKKFSQEERAFQSAMKSYQDAAVAGLTMDAENTAKADNIIRETAKKSVVRDHIKQLKKEDKLEKMLIAQQLAEGKSEEEAKTFAADRIDQLKKEGKNLAKEYDLLGGDKKLVDGVAGDLKEFRGLGLSLNFEDDAVKKAVMEAEQKLRAKTKNKANVEALLSEENKKEAQELKTTATSMLEAMKVEATEENIKSVQNILKESKSSEDMVKKISETLGVDAGAVQFSEEQFVNLSSAREQRMAAIAEYQSVLEAYKLQEKGEEMFMSKIGPGVSTADKDRILEVFRNVNDENLASSNVNSLGYKLNVIIKENGGNMDDPKVRALMEAERNKMKAQLDTEFKAFGDKYGNEIRQYDTAKKFKEEMNAVETMSVMTEVQHQREFHIGTRMDTQSIQTVVNDSLIQDMHSKGDYAGAGLKLQMLVDCIKKHDIDEARNLGFDQQTVDKLAEWEKNEKTKARLDGIRGLGELDAAHMGSITSSMGGGSWTGMETALAKLTAVSEKNILIKKFETALNDAASNEARARSQVSEVLNQIDATFSGEMWRNERILEIFAEKTGTMFENGQQFADKLTEALNAVNYGADKDDPNIKPYIEAFNAVQKEYLGQPGMEVLTDAARMFNNAIARADEANMWSTRQDEINHGIGSFKSELQEIMAKLKAFAGGK